MADNLSFPERREPGLGQSEEVGQEALEASLTAPKTPEVKGVPRRFETEAERDHLADEAAKILPFKSAESPLPPGMHMEAGVPLKEDIRSEEERRAEITKLIQNPDKNITKPGGADAVFNKIFGKKAA